MAAIAHTSLNLASVRGQAHAGRVTAPPTRPPGTAEALAHIFSSPSFLGPQKARPPFLIRELLGCTSPPISARAGTNRACRAPAGCDLTQRRPAEEPGGGPPPSLPAVPPCELSSRRPCALPPTGRRGRRIRRAGVARPAGARAPHSRQDPPSPHAPAPRGGRGGPPPASAVVPLHYILATL